MAGRIRQEDIEAVRERTDILKLVGGYLTLKKAGHDSFVGICPFHQEKTPSLSVSPTKGVYHCFGCGAGGDAIRFLREIESLDFVEAVERLAGDAGIALRYEGESPADRRAASRRQALYDANDRAAELYRRTLAEAREGAEARAYLESRGIDGEAATTFGVGYAPMYADFLLRRLSPRFSPELLVEAGLAVRDAGGTIRDRFRGRITFPVHDLSGHAVGLGARQLPREDAGASGPKYLNSPETPVYRKGEMLYNLNRAKPAVARSGEAFVVEGYTDVIALHQAGVETAVATCGTALSEGHFRLLSRFARRAVLSFDSDEAGARAAERAYAFHERFDLDAVVLVLPEGQDPADFVRAHGGDAFRELAGGAVPLVEYMVRRTLSAHDASSVEGRSRAVRAALPVVSGLTDPIRREEYAHLLADLVGVSDTSVMLELERAGRSGRVAVRSGEEGGPQAADSGTPARLSPQHRAEREMLKLLVQDAEVYGELADRLREEHFDRAQHRRLFALLRERGTDVRGMVSEEEDERLASALSALAVEATLGEGPSYAAHVHQRLEELLLDRRIDAIRRSLQKLNPVTSPDYEPLFEELIALEGDRRRIRDRSAS
ncbi:MAG: DNA primase [Actinobacteria bacterium]|nr:DNA primase [Actinomycetota bacterium]